MVKIFFSKNRKTEIDNIWKIINDPKIISNRNYDHLMKFFGIPSKYLSFIEIVRDFKKKIRYEYCQEPSNRNGKYKRHGS